MFTQAHGPWHENAHDGLGPRDNTRSSKYTPLPNQFGQAWPLIPLGKMHVAATGLAQRQSDSDTPSDMHARRREPTLYPDDHATNPAGRQCRRLHPQAEHFAAVLLANDRTCVWSRTSTTDVEWQNATCTSSFLMVAAFTGMQTKMWLITVSIHEDIIHLMPIARPSLLIVIVCTNSTE